MKYIIPLIALGACVTTPKTAPDNVLIDMGEIETEISGKCFAKDVSPAVIETVTTQEVVSEEVRDPDGTVIRPATFRTVTRQNIVRERADIRFETVCPQTYTAEFVATLQRALKVRGFYAGLVTGTLDAPTGAALRRFQRNDGPDTPLLAIATARKLGLVAVARD